MCPIVCAFYTGAGLNLIRAYVLGQGWFYNIRQRDVLEIRSATDTKLAVSVISTLHLRMTESHTWMTLVFCTTLPFPYY